MCLRLLRAGSPPEGECPPPQVSSQLPPCMRGLPIGALCEGGDGMCGTRDECAAATTGPRARAPPRALDCTCPRTDGQGPVSRRIVACGA
eukprot:1160007-Prymnesium_polylepis.1